MKLKKVLIFLITLIIVVIVSTLLHYQNMNYISENWNIDFPSENTIVYQVKPSPSFTNDGIYYEVQEVKNKKLPITLSNKKNNEIEEEFNKYIIDEYSANGRPLVTVEKSTQYAGQVHLTKKMNTVGSPQLI